MIARAWQAFDAWSDRYPWDFALGVAALCLLMLSVFPEPPGPVDCEGAYVRLLPDNSWECHDQLEDFQ